MIRGLGNDIIEIARIEQSIARHGDRFLERLFSPEEQRYCGKHKNSATHFAGRFAAKEAIAKALGTGFRRELGWRDIVITNDSLGKPIVTLSESAAIQFNSPTIHLTISHCKNYASAVAIVV